MTLPDNMITIRLVKFWEPVHQCCMCGRDCPPDYGVAYCCGPTHDEIGSISSEYADTEVGGATACKLCHDRHYDLLPTPQISAMMFVAGCPYCHGTLAPRYPQSEMTFQTTQ